MMLYQSLNNVWMILGKFIIDKIIHLFTVINDPIKNSQFMQREIAITWCPRFGLFLWLVILATSSSSTLTSASAFPSFANLNIKHKIFVCFSTAIGLQVTTVRSKG